MSENKQKSKSETKHKWLHVRLTESEHKQIHDQFARTTERKISAYSRKIMLGKPMIQGYRNLSSETTIEQFTKLNKDLNGIANNFNQITHKLHTLRSIPEFQSWVITYNRDKIKLLQDIENIRDFMNKNAAIWLQ